MMYVADSDCNMLGKEEAQTLSSHLEDTEKFPSVNLIVEDRLTIDAGIMEICRKR